MTKNNTNFIRSFSKVLGMVVPFTFIAACGDSSPIVVSPADMLSVTVMNTQGGPIVGANISFDKIKFKINTPATVPPTPYTTPGDFEEASGMQTTDTDGKTAFFLPRHGTVNSKDVLVVNQSWGNMYSFVLTPQINVDMVTTVLYEMLAYSTVSQSSFTVQQLLSLQKHAYKSINTAIANYWLNPNAPMAKLHRAYQNALSADASFITELQQTALSNGFLLAGYVPFQLYNTQSNVVAASPRQFSPVVIEGNQLAFSVSGFDVDHDTVFYSWVILPFDPLTVPNVMTQIYQGQLLFSEVGGNTTSNLSTTTDYSTVPWYQGGGTKSVFLAAIVSDGFTPKTLQYWNMSVQNKERLPVFTTTPPTTALEDSTWTYTPSAYSPDGAPMKLTLAAPVAGMDMCVPDKYYMPNPPANLPALATPQVWTWQIAGTPCNTPGLITWTPNNCQSGPVLSPIGVSISAVDQTGTGGVQNFQVTVVDVNTAPVITSTPPNLSITGPTPWSYTPTLLDPESVASAIQPGAHGCGDVFVYKLLTFPTGATISSTTGLINWTPAGNQVGANFFKVQVDDSHGGITTQTWTVTVIDMNDTPVITAVSCPTTAHMATLNAQGLASYNCSVTVSQWNINSLFQMIVTGAPPGALLYPSAGSWVAPALVNGMSWVPSDANTPNSWAVTIQACNDGEGGKFAPLCSNTISYTLNAPKEDLPPKIKSTPPVTVMGGCMQADCAVIGASHMVYNAIATDGNATPADTFTFTSTQPNPAGAFAMSMTPVSTTAPTGTVTLDWQVNNDTDLGSHTLSLKATSGLVANGGPQFSLQSWSIYVQETNRIPYFDAIPGQTGQNGIPYTYNFKTACHTNAATSPNKTLSFKLGAGSPTGMQINSKTGVISWNPTSAQAKASQPTNYTVICQSKQGTPFTSASVTVPVTLSWVNQAPIWTNVPTQFIGVGQNYSLPLSTSDPDGDAVTLGIVSKPAGATFSQASGSGLFTWTPILADVGIYNVTFNASDGSLTTPMIVKFQVVNSPIVLSHPVLHATASFPYHYELHALDPIGGGLTYALSSDTPSGVQVTPIAGTPPSAMISWSPSLGAAGDQILTLTLTDANGATAIHTWHVNVTTGSENPPNIASVTPTGIVGAPAIATEGTAMPINVSASDPDGDPLHYAYYWDGKWLDDTASAYNYTPGSLEAGDHTLTVAVTDGASADVTLDTPVHVRDAIPMLGQTYTGGTLTAMLTNPRTNQIFATVGGGSPALTIFDEATMQTGPVGGTALPFAPQRISLRNDFPTATDYVAYFSQLGDLLAGGNNFASFDSTASFNVCGAGPCFGPAFTQGLTFASGSQTVRVQSNNTTYYVKSSNRRYLGTFVGAAAGADIDLGVGASGNSVLFDPTGSRVYVATGGTHKVIIINPATNTITTQVAGVGNSPSLMTINSAAGKLYVYSPVDGSIAEILTSGGTLSFVRSGFPTSALIGADSPTLMVENTDDDVIYLGNPDLHELVVFDIANSGIRTLDVGSGPNELSFDMVSHTLVGASFSIGKLFQEK